MRKYILTERERQIIFKVLEGKRPDSYRVLKHIIDKSLLRIEEDLDLIKKFLEIINIS